MPRHDSALLRKCGACLRHLHRKDSFRQFNCLLLHGQISRDSTATFVWLAQYYTCLNDAQHKCGRRCLQLHGRGSTNQEWEASQLVLNY